MQQPHILGILEDVSQHEALRSAFAKYDYDTQFATHIEEAKKFLSQDEFSVVLLDLPVDENFFIHLEKAQQNHPTRRVIVISSNPKDDFLLQLLQAQIFAFLPKPFEVEDLLTQIKAALELPLFVPQWKVVSAVPHWIEINIPAHDSFISALNSFLFHFLKELPRKESRLLLYAVQELVQNAIEHGNKRDPHKKINFRCLKSKNTLVFQVQDQGEGFLIGSLPHAAIGNLQNSPIQVAEYRKKKGMRPGGLGISSVLRIADGIIFNESGNAVMMIKRWEETGEEV